MNLSRRGGRFRIRVSISATRRTSRSRCASTSPTRGLPLVVPGTHVGTAQKQPRQVRPRDQDIVEAGELRQRRIAPHALARAVAP
ncbi:hypothetical protein Ae717Ps2_7231c [Pseudonocardia sp. Ae717_Ps2]|nr:hypothetical protein Ae717Ps2_7231c [Pseudonocardia sp. Ae717_Ps2]